MKPLIPKLLLCLFFLFAAAAVRADDVIVVARVHSLREARDAIHYPFVLESEGLSATLAKLDPSDEVLMKGRIEYHPVTREGRTEMNPTFHVEKLIPVSLARLGKVELVHVEQKVTFAAPGDLSPKTLPVSGAVANAITLTASLLMLKDLSGNQKTQPVRDGLNTGLLFSAGVLATGVYLWEQLKRPE